MLLFASSKNNIATQYHNKSLSKCQLYLNYDKNINKLKLLKRFRLSMY